MDAVDFLHHENPPTWAFKANTQPTALPSHVYTDGSRDDYYRSGSEIYMKSQDHILRIQRRNPDGCSVFRSELIAIDEALGSLASLPTGKEIWTLSDSREQYSTCPISKA
ncbi:uncharacterized protein TNCV_259901 [Trichonephila clavipes]|uniref:RNase H type-1 domain-containing protein n=1 Tax=Trichonephila clavipes TaxID=2585209 RepID=A0A8X6RS12_TRICX|nr:uncharacterized protein TNCV_259901 [Trichonephila clavipes]